jgi:hypothetical protein
LLDKWINLEVDIRVSIMATQFDIEKLLDKTFFGFDILAMLGDIEDFLEFSEANIEWQMKRELRRAAVEAAVGEFEDERTAAQYKEQMLESVEYRFGINLAQRVRYSGLVSLITTVEWVLLALKGRVTFPVPARPRGTNEAVHLLVTFNKQASLNLSREIGLLESLVHVRNCVVHAAGLLNAYQFENELRASVQTLDGVRVSSMKFLGESIEIDQGCLQRILEDMKLWLPRMEESMHKQGLLK